MAYVDVDELARVLRLRDPTGAQGTAMQRVLDTAAYEIDVEVFGTAEFGTAQYVPPYPALVVEVNLERAVEHWQQQDSPFGVIGISESTPIMSAKDSFDRHAHKLAPLKESWGIG